MALVPAWAFRELDPAEAASFRAWARDNYEPGEAVNEAWHPVVRAECEAMNREVQRAGEALDREWQREIAMEAGMGLGVEAYNDAMGWGRED